MKSILHCLVCIESSLSQIYFLIYLLLCVKLFDFTNTKCRGFSKNHEHASNVVFLQKLVVKPDQLIKRRGKLGLIKAGVDLEGVKEWLKNKLGREFEVRLHIHKNED